MMWGYCVVIANLFGLAAGWHLVMKVPQGNLGGASSVYDLWTSNMTLNPDADNVMSIQPGIPYKSADALDWHNKNISLVSSFVVPYHHVCWVFESRRGLWIVSCEEAIQLRGSTLVPVCA